MSALPAHLETDLEAVYRLLRVTKKHVPVIGVDNMAGYPGAEVDMGSTWAAAEPDPADPLAHLEHDDAVSVGSENLGRRILPMPRLEDPSGPADLDPDLAAVASRPVSPFRFAKPEDIQIPPSSRSDDDARSSAESAADEQFHRAEEGASDGHPGMVPGPLKIDPVSREKFRKRLREALEIVNDETKPLTIGSLMTVVDEITNLDARLSLMERKLEADRRSTRYLIGVTAKSEAAASEVRIKNEMGELRRQVDIWRTQVPAATSPAPAQPVATLGDLSDIPLHRSKRGFRRG